MTLALIAFAAALVAWPAPRPGERRVHGLVGAARLGGPSRVRRWRWRAAVPSRVAIALAAAGAGSLAVVWRGPVVGAAAAVAVAVGLSAVGQAMRRSATRARDRDLSTALRLVRAELDVGSSAVVALTAASSVAGAHRPAFAAAASALADGRDVGAAVGEVSADPQLIVIAQAWQLATALGIPLAGVLARVDDDVQASREQNRVVAAALAGPRSSAALLAGLPVLGIVLGLAMGADPLHVLLDTGGGRLLLAAGVLLDAVGVLWTDRLISSAERL
jgi:tight adherence protein B